MRVGLGSDIHKLVEGRKLVLGGVIVPSEKGELAHSDGDVVYHAIGDAVLGALALGDLGKFFPDNDPKYEGISSLLLLDEVVKMMEDKGFKINNIDIQVAAKSPKLAEVIDQMRSNIASHLHTNIENVSVKAMTFNGVGPIGEGKAIKASSYVMLDGSFLPLMYVGMKSIGPGLYSDIPAMMSSSLSGFNIFMNCVIPLDSSWKHPSVLPSLIIL